MKSLSSSGPAAQQFIAQVNRILEEGSARQESDQEMTGKIAHAASATNLPSQAGTRKSCSRQFLCALSPAYQSTVSCTEMHKSSRQPRTHAHLALLLGTALEWFAL